MLQGVEAGCTGSGQLGGEALLDALRGDGRACNGGSLRPIGVSGTGIAGGAAEH